MFVTHDIEEALRLADRIVILEGGGIVQHDTPLNILMKPATGFVRDLVGSDDVLRYLSLVPVITAMSPLAVETPHRDASTIGSEENLRTALSLLLRSQTQKLEVLKNGNVIGILTFEHIRLHLSR